MCHRGESDSFRRFENARVVDYFQHCEATRGFADQQERAGQHTISRLAVPWPFDWAEPNRVMDGKAYKGVVPVYGLSKKMIAKHKAAGITLVKNVKGKWALPSGIRKQFGYRAAGIAQKERGSLITITLCEKCGSATMFNESGVATQRKFHSSRGGFCIGTKGIGV